MEFIPTGPKDLPSGHYFESQQELNCVTALQGLGVPGLGVGQKAGISGARRWTAALLEVSLGTVSPAWPPCLGAWSRSCFPTNPDFGSPFSFAVLVKTHASGSHMSK